MKTTTFFSLVAITAIATSCNSEKPTYIEPHLTTLGATDITRTEATLNGTATIEGDADMPQLCFRYGTTSTMQQSTSIVNLQGSTVSFPLKNLTAGSTYYYMLQGNNGRTTINSNTMTFTTQPNEKPSLGETTVLSHGPMSVIIGYQIAENGGESILETGCYCKQGSEQKKVILSHYDGGVGQQKLLIDNLQCNTTYQIQPYAQNKIGETLGEAITFTTGDAIILQEAGDFTALMGNSLYDYTSITLAGSMNGDDLNCLRKMMGRNGDGTSTLGKLTQIDMTDVKIVAGGGTYDASRYTQDHVIGQGLFANCEHLTQVSLPFDATTLEKDAFAGCTSLIRIEIPAAIANLQPSSGCTALQEIKVSSANANYSSKDGVLLNGVGSKIVWFPMGKQGCYTLPSTVTSIGDYAFKGCNVENFTLPDGLTSIGQGAFMDSKVKEVKLPASLKAVPTSTFQGCTQLKVVRLGNKTELISDYAFDLCPLTDIYVEAKLPPVCNAHAFTTRGANFLNTCTLHVPADQLGIYKANESWQQFKNIIAY